ALASLPTFLLLKERAVPRGPKERAVPRPAKKTAPFIEAWREVGHTLRQVRQFTDLARFLLCSLFYQAGIQAVITLAAIYASQAMGFSTRETLLLIFAVNITAAIGAFLFGHVQDRIGHVRTIALTLIGWIGAIGLLWAAPDASAGLTVFWIAANLAGLCLGAAQSAGRALVGLLAPPSRLAEFYGFWGLSVKLSAIMGPLTYGIVTWVTGGDHRSALLLTGGFFIVGLILLSGVKAGRGRRAALCAARLDAVASRP
ncbi:MAG: MFS transporter, partial [Rhodocyclaceae bacterium]|nr:MFS transporter [Rhodocyclaceae bacterium]